MIANNVTPGPHAFRARRVLALGCIAALSLMSCDKNAAGAKGTQTQATSSAKAGGVSMCKLMPKEEVNAAIGSSYTIVEARDERSTSSCHYSSETDPAGLSLDLQWIEPSDYSSPAEHAALQAAGLGGAKLGGKLTAGMAPGAVDEGNGPMHIPSGPVKGVGDEATQNLLLLTARKGDYLLMVQIVPDVLKLMQDTTAGPKVQDNERKLARSVLAKV